MKTTKRIVAMVLFTVLLMGNVCYAGTWKTININSVTKNYTSSTFVSNGDVLLDFSVFQAAAYGQADFGTVEFQSKNSSGQWVTIETISKPLAKGSTSLITYFGGNFKTIRGTCRLVFYSDSSVRIQGSIKYFQE